MYSFAKVNSRETQKFRDFFHSRKFLPAKVSSLKVVWQLKPKCDNLSIIFIKIEVVAANWLIDWFPLVKFGSVNDESE